MARDYRAEYARRKARAEAKGTTFYRQRVGGGSPGRPLDALRHPERFPLYVARNFRSLNALSRRRGERRRVGPVQVGIGVRGEAAEHEAEDRVIAGRPPLRPWTYVADVEPEGMRRSFGYATLAEAQEAARGSGASPGAVLIFHEPDTGLYAMYFLDYSAPKHRRRIWTDDEIEAYNARRKREQEIAIERYGPEGLL